MFDLGRTLLASALRMPDAVAISDSDLSRTYVEWRDEILQLVGGLDGLGLTRGDHVVTVLQNRYEAATLHMACQLAGLVITPLNWRAKPDELDYVLGDAQAKALFFQPETAEAVAGAGNAASIARVGVDIEEGASTTWSDPLGVVRFY